MVKAKFSKSSQVKGSLVKKQRGHSEHNTRPCARSGLGLSVSVAGLTFLDCCFFTIQKSTHERKDMDVVHLLLLLWAPDLGVVSCCMKQTFALDGEGGLWCVCPVSAPVLIAKLRILVLSISNIFPLTSCTHAAIHHLPTSEQPLGGC